jgi:hypothetical protein
MTRDGGRRAGIALVAVLSTLALLAVLTAGSLATTSALRSGARLGIAGTQTMTATEFALELPAAEWRSRAVADLAVGATTSWADGTGAVAITRISPTLVWMVAEGRGHPDALRRAGRVLRIPDLPFDSLGIVTAAGPVVVGNNVTIAPPTSLESLCGADLLGRIVLAQGQTVRDMEGSTVTSPPSVARANDTTVYKGIDRLMSLYLGSIAEVSLPGGASITLAGPEQFVHAAGSIAVTGGAGAGILYVDGALEISGQTTFSGLIVATGGVTLSGGPTSITGLIVSGPGPDPVHPATTYLAGVATLRPALCAVRAALQSLIPPRPVGGRSWAELY